MAVVSVEPVSTRVNGEANGHRSYVSTWRVITNSRSDGASTARTATGLPAFGDYYRWGSGLGPGGSNSWDLGAWVQGAHSATLQNEEASLKVWLVTVTHTSQGRSAETEQPDDPLSAPWEVSRDADEWTEEATQTVFVNNMRLPIWNSALRAIGGKAVERYRTRGKWTLTKNFIFVPQSWVEEYEGSINSSAVTICGHAYAKWCCYLRKIALQRMHYAASSIYYRATFYVDTKEDTFNLKIPDKGRHQWDGVGNQNDPDSYVEIVDSLTQNPQPDGSYYLDGNGGILQKDQAPVILNAPDGFQVYEAMDWGVFNFPST